MAASAVSSPNSDSEVTLVEPLKVSFPSLLFSPIISNRVVNSSSAVEGDSKSSLTYLLSSSHQDSNEVVEENGAKGLEARSDIRQSFKFFHETEYSQHGPKGAERARYFL